jgi:lipopolysaccharide transport system ATP-binding protein
VSVLNETLAINVVNATVRFNLEREKLDNLKEYFVKLIRRELMFQEFLALQDVNLKVKKGESWGIVGGNGAGKSTLLKLICKIIAPYKGCVETNGSIAPLIELGAGFDGNLTARENIFLNGAILGYSRSFMKESFDDIVEFAQIAKFIDVPVKNFSSGMRARLGFAIATAVDPDILIVDEVLAVGDSAFQKKCAARMQSMRQKGTTLLFVSHNIAQVRDICERAMWLDQGRTVMTGAVGEVCDAYMASQKNKL